MERNSTHVAAKSSSRPGKWAVAGGPSYEALVRLVPARRIRQRPSPYLGDTVFVSLRDLGHDNAAIARDLYEFVAALNDWLDGTAGGVTPGQLLRFIIDRRFDGLATRVTRLGADLRNESASPTLRKALHDIRGGSLTGLVAHLDLLLIGRGTDGDVERVAVLARDHCKILRNAIVDLDPAGRERDLVQRQHTVALIRDKWSGARLRPEAGAHSEVRVEVACEFEGAVSDRCMELAALDRVLYNLVANAARFTYDGAVQLAIFPIDDEPDTHLRFAVSNAIAPEHYAVLNARFGDDLGKMFVGGFTTGGHGLGMRICGDIVTHGYGLRSVDDACSHGYLGARVIDERFVTWFHWPARAAGREVAAS